MFWPNDVNVIFVINNRIGDSDEKSDSLNQKINQIETHARQMQSDAQKQTKKNSELKRALEEQLSLLEKNTPY